MKNYFEELHEKGEDTCELTLREIQDLFKKGRITQDQFTKIIIDNYGIEAYTKWLGESLEDYFKDLHDEGKKE